MFIIKMESKMTMLESARGILRKAAVAVLIPVLSETVDAQSARQQRADALAAAQANAAAARANADAAVANAHQSAAAGTAKEVDCTPHLPNAQKTTCEVVSSGGGQLYQVFKDANDPATGVKIKEFEGMGQITGKGPDGEAQVHVLGGVGPGFVTLAIQAFARVGGATAVPPLPSVQTPVPMQTAVQPVETKAAAKVNDDGSVVVRVANLKMGSPGEVTITPEVDKNGHPIGGVHFKLKITHAGTAVGDVTDIEEWTFEGAATGEETGKGKKTRNFLGGGFKGVLDSQNTNQDAAIFVCNDPEKCFNVTQSAMGDKRKNEIGSDGSVMSGFKAYSGRTPPKFTMMAGTAAALVDAWNKGKDALLSYIAGGGKSPIDPKDPRIGKEILALQGTAAKFGITVPVSAPQTR